MSKELLLNPNLPQSGHRTLTLQLAEHRHILLTVDGLLVLAALIIGLWLGAQRSGWVFSLELILEYTPWFLGVLALYFVLAGANDAYRPRVAADPAASLVAILKTILQIFGLYLVIYALLPPYSLPRHFIGFFSLISPVLLLSWRRLYSLAFAMSALQRRAIVVGAGWAGQTIVKTLRDYVPAHFEVLAYVDDNPARQQMVVQDVPVLGPTATMAALAQQLNATDIVLAINHNVSGEILARLLACYEAGLNVSTMPDLYEQLTDRVPVEHVGDQWFVVLPLAHSGQNASFRLVKRAMDVAMAAVGLAVFGLLLPVLALAIKLDSPGPVFYRQKRVGRAGKVYELIKLRSMTVGAEADGLARWAEKYDGRVTRIGRFLRRTRLDEAPQLLNVLRGEMSLVGPRPERPEFVAGLEQEIPFYRTRLTVKPGLTGWAQVNYDYGRTVTDALEKLRYDLYYIKHQSIQLDLVILFKTVGTILMFKGV
jgi:exopolysaccharide biosynthesis polyprenyl glycosylphosphotransferase